LAAPQTEEDTSLFGGNKEGTQMNEAPNENMLEIITPSECPTVIQQSSCRQSNQDDRKQRLLGKRRRLTASDPVDTCFMGYTKQQTSSKTPEPGAKCFRSQSQT
jgi:hypothetical protein